MIAQAISNVSIVVGWMLGMFIVLIAYLMFISSQAKVRARTKEYLEKQRAFNDSLRR